MERKSNFYMGPKNPSNIAEKFWNITSINDDEGEITLYGDVMSKRPVDWWTGEPKPGFYITPEGFMEDLELVKNKAHITVRLNSCGGDLYTGIAIHNALKNLTGEVNVIVEGIAASAASVIMCAGDTVTVYPGSLVMIHGVSVLMWDSMTIKDMEQMIKGMDASERAVSEIYNAKTGIDIDTLRSMMNEETWMTGREAYEKGFADSLKEDEEELEMSMTTDRKVLFVNGIRHSLEGLRNVPGTIPVAHSVPAFKASTSQNTINNRREKGEKKKMTVEELKNSYPALIAEIQNEARSENAVEASEMVNQERKRIQEIDEIAATVPDQKMVYDAKYGENPCTAQELCFQVMKVSAEVGNKFLENYQKDWKNSGALSVGAAPNNGVGLTKNETDQVEIAEVVNAYNGLKGAK